MTEFASISSLAHFSRTPLRIALIASGDGPIPPVGWSTVQSMAWDLCHTLTAKGHAPFLVHTRN